MKPSPFVTLGLASVLLVARPNAARGAEPEPDAPIPTFVKAPSVVPALGARLSLLAGQPLQTDVSLFAKAPEDIRLSRGAKTAIIITAIVVGVLLVVGVVAVTRPGHL